MVSRLLRLVKHYKTKGKQSPKHKKPWNVNMNMNIETRHGFIDLET